ncbi:MAG: hypothetical protein HOC34_03270 [Candidatus Magasanikbacteria bacterium]|mgnify:CR=1 FL=1|jgi:hypothetical protein|nr:hypothetical protein [Candidatus Magasanikbacteria bacterium]MBT4350493.1 hypothetical protein [Candidatus Magasanikbacteria bacterium]MBT4541954.1 hypothetical protein [Candidatus Magasanikbacteria bacterium]MBT6334572.1 hypothetical protein [Candidatus Magasanikbacteria bacterium]
MQLQKIDPFYYLLRYIILKKFFSTNIKKHQTNFVLENIMKHRQILWINVITLSLAILGFISGQINDLNTVAIGLAAPVMFLGGAWFAVSFGGIPKNLLTLAMTITFWIFSAFSIALSLMITTLIFVTPWHFWPALIIIYIGTVFACIQYDTTDGLKVGLDEAQLRHSRAALLFYEKQGINPEEGS